MKKLLLTICFLFALQLANAQINLEHTYTGRVYSHYLNNGDVIYSNFNNATGAIKLYTSSHSILKEITVPQVTGARLDGDIKFLSDKLFDADAGIEFCVGYYSESGYKFKVLDESGSVLLDVSVSSWPYPELIKTSNGFKLLLNNTNSGNGTSIYSLPGSSPLATKSEINSAYSSLPYPNPAGLQISIPYSLNGSNKATIHIFDASGKEIETFKVDSTFDHLLLNTSNYRSGTYVYKITSQDTLVVTKKFIVNK